MLLFLYRKDIIRLIFQVKLYINNTDNGADNSDERTKENIKVAVFEIVDSTSGNINRKQQRRETHDTNQPVFTSFAISNI